MEENTSWVGEKDKPVSSWKIQAGREFLNNPSLVNEKDFANNKALLYWLSLYGCDISKIKKGEDGLLYYSLSYQTDKQREQVYKILISSETLGGQVCFNPILFQEEGKLWKIFLADVFLDKHSLAQITPFQETPMIKHQQLFRSFLRGKNVDDLRIICRNEQTIGDFLAQIKNVRNVAQLATKFLEGLVLIDNASDQIKFLRKIRFAHDITLSSGTWYRVTLLEPDTQVFFVDKLANDSRFVSEDFLITINGLTKEARMILFEKKVKSVAGDFLINDKVVKTISGWNALTQMALINKINLESVFSEEGKTKLVEKIRTFIIKKQCLGSGNTRQGLPVDDQSESDIQRNLGQYYQKSVFLNVNEFSDVAQQVFYDNLPEGVIELNLLADNDFMLLFAMSSQSSSQNEFINHLPDNSIQTVTKEMLTGISYFDPYAQFLFFKYKTKQGSISLGLKRWAERIYLFKGNISKPIQDAFNKKVVRK